MSPEIISAEAIAVVSGAAGMVAHKYAQHRAEQSGERMYVEATAKALEDREDTVQLSRRQRLANFAGRTLLSPLPLVAFATAGSLAYGLNQEPQQIHESAPPAVKFVVDGSGATRFANENGKTPASEINELASKFNNKDVNGEALIATAGKVTIQPISEISKNTPIGGAPIAEAIDLGLSRSSTNVTHSAAPQSTMLVLTNGNPIDNAANLAAKAKQQNARISIVNVGNPSEVSPEAKNEFQQTTQATGGTYWEASEANLNDVANNVKDNLVPQEASTKAAAKWPFVEFAAIGLLGMGAYFRRAKDVATLKKAV